jgi:hypothetical protein
VIAGTVTVAVVVASVLATEVAITLTCKSFVGGPGAVYVMATPLAVDVGEGLPHGAVEHDTVQVTPLLLESPATVAVNCVVPVPETLAVEGTTVTATEGTVIVAGADLLVSATEVAVNVTVRLLAGSETGAE